MLDKPTAWNRFLAAMTGEVPADALEAYRPTSRFEYGDPNAAPNH